jgi:hypothetical protein
MNTTDLALHQHEPVQSDPTGGRLVAWAEAAAAANRLAKALCRTEFCPVAFRSKDIEATAAILLGDELGMSPLVALKSIYVVHGTPALYARTMVGLAQAHGHEIWTVETSDAKVVVRGQRKGSDHIEEAIWTTTRAQKAGYTNNKQYVSNPQAMLYAKAAGEIARKIAADVLSGMAYSVEDMELEQAEPTATVKRSEATTKVKRADVPKLIEAQEVGMVGDPIEPTPEVLEQMAVEQT